jgi:hypothetical protein
VVTAVEHLSAASMLLDERLLTLERLARYYDGRQGCAFLSPAAREAIGDRLQTLPVNLVRVAVDVLAERLEVQGFRVGDTDGDAGLWDLWRASRMVTGSASAHLDSLLYGTGYVSVWTTPDGRPRICSESPRSTTVTLDPATGEPIVAVTRRVRDKHGHATVFEPDRVTLLRTVNEVSLGTLLPLDGWAVADVLPNALGEVPVTVLPNRPRTGAPLGESEVTDALPLVDGLSKLTQDMLVVSEAHSRPRRWATGLEVVEDEEGNPVNPFTESPERVWQAEDPAVKFGEFSATGLDGFVAGIGVLLRAISAVTAVPPATLGLACTGIGRGPARQRGRARRPCPSAADRAGRGMGAGRPSCAHRPGRCRLSGLHRRRGLVGRRRNPVGDRRSRSCIETFGPGGAPGGDPR